MRFWERRTVARRGEPRARANVVVEFAVILPLLLTILFGIIEFGYIFMVRQTLQHAAREGSRIASLQTSVPADVTARVNEVMAPTEITTFQVDMTSTPATCQELVTVSVPYNDVSLLGGYFGTYNFDLTQSCIMHKEGCTVE